MSRSLKKGPYINVKLEKKVLAMNESGKKAVVKTWARASMISPDFVGHTIAVHNGNKFIPVFVTENIISVVTGIQESENKKNRIKWVLEKEYQLKQEKKPKRPCISRS